jgi:ATP-binding cassette subfamily B (MDR/TAP) protein 1
VYPTVPYKPLLLLGAFTALLSGAMTPVFSFLLSRLMFEVSIGATNTSVINTYGGIVLAVAALDGLLLGLKYFIMETSGMIWITRLRQACFKLILAQDKKWFDRSANSPVRLVQVLVKDGDDARNLVAVVLAQCCVVCAMLGVGLVWALVQGWQLTLVGFAIAPVFAATMAMQTSLVAKCELRNKRAREEVAKGYYEAISNVRGIRSMGFERVFQAQFDEAAERALGTGVRGAFVEGCTYGVASALIYLAEALLFYVGAVLIARGTYSYLQMIQVLNLVVFSVTIGSQLMAFTQKIAKSVQATRDFNQLLKLSARTDESEGTLRPLLEGPITFKNITFSYPERPDVPVLKDISMELAPGECVALVGASGSGKSTVAALLQRLYEPTAGSISIGAADLRATDVHHLRENVAVVSQHPNLFDASIAANIAYGRPTLSDADIQCAARAAHVHDFVLGLPQGYATPVGAHAALISGGQAQRLQIARALARRARVLVLDEATAALDGAAQAAVLAGVRAGAGERTALVVTHRLAVMRACDRVVVLQGGVVAEEGTYEALLARGGVFAALARGGEWVGE